MNLVQKYKEVWNKVVRLQVWVTNSDNKKTYASIDIKDIKNNAVFILPEKPERGSINLFSYDSLHLAGWGYDYNKNQLFFASDFVQQNDFPSSITVQYQSLT